MYFEILDICTRVKDLYENPDEPEDKPHLLVLDKFKFVVLRAYTYLPKGPVHASIFPANQPGGLRVQWSIDPTKDFVALQLVPPESGEDHVYYVHDGEAGMEKEVTAERLIEHLEKLIKPLDTPESVVYTN